MLFAQSGDLFFTSGEGVLADTIQWAEQVEGEGETEVNHTGGVTHSGWIVPPEVQQMPLAHAKVSEALWRVKHWEWWPNHNHQENYTVEVWRHRTMTLEEIDRVISYWTKQTGQKYGWWKLLAHFVDNKVFGGRRLFRRLLGKVEDRPICSFHMARGYDKVGIHFGGYPNEASPDSMHDWVKMDPQWMLVGRETINVS